MAQQLDNKRITAKIPDQIWAPAAGGLITFLVGLFSILIGQPFLLANLGPTVYLQAAYPNNPSSRFVNVVVGHIVGIIAGFIGGILFDAVNDPVVLVDKTLTGARLGAAVAGIILTILVTLLLKVAHPPAAATTLLVASGSIQTNTDYLNLIIGILIIAILGEIICRARIESIQRQEIKTNIPENASG